MFNFISKFIFFFTSQLKIKLSPKNHILSLSDPKAIKFSLTALFVKYQFRPTMKSLIIRLRHFIRSR